MPHSPSSPAPALTRRQALQAAVIGALALPSLPAMLRGAESASEPDSTPAAPPQGREHGLRLGVATYSTRMMSLDETIATLRVLRIVNCGLYKNHLPLETMTPDEARAIAGKLHAAGIALTGSGVVNLVNDEAKCRKAFDNAKAAGLVTMVCRPEPDALPLVEKLAREYDQRLAIHNHGPEDKLYKSPADAWKAVSSLDARIGLCIDVGHALRAGADPVAAIRQYASRLYDLHMKDTVAIAGAVKDLPVEVGTGRIDVRGIVQALRAIRYEGVMSFEYEKTGVNPVTGLAESIGFVRGVLAATVKG